MMSDLSAEHLDRLERSNRRLTRAVVALTLLILAGLFIGAAREHPRTLDAERITLRDKAGRVRTELIADRDGPGLTLFDAEGTERARVHAADDGTTTLNLATPTKEGAPSRSIKFRSAVDGWSLLSFTDSTKQERLAVGLGYDGEPRLRMYTKDGKARVTLGSDM